MNALWSELFVIGVLITVGIVTKFIGHMSSLGGGDIKLILSTCLYLEIKETFCLFIFGKYFRCYVFSSVLYSAKIFKKRR